MLIHQRLEDFKQSDWFLFFISLSIAAMIGIIVLGSSLANIPILFVTSLILLFISIIPLWFGILQGIFGKERMYQPILMVLGLIAVLILSIGFFWALSTITVTDSTRWMKEGTSTVIAGIIGALAYDIITKSHQKQTLTSPKTSPLPRPDEPIPYPISDNTNQEIDKFFESVITWNVSDLKKRKKEYMM